MTKKNQTLGLIKFMATCKKVTVTCDKCGKTHTVGAHMVGSADKHKECGGIFRIHEGAIMSLTSAQLQHFIDSIQE